MKKRENIIKSLILILLVKLMLPIAGDNLIENSSFETGMRGWSVNNTHYYADRFTFEKIHPVSTEKKVGQKSLQITKKGEEWLNIVSQPYVLKPGGKYFLSFFYKSDISKHPIAVSIHACGMSTGPTGLIVRTYLKCKKQWQRAVLEFNVPTDPAKIGYKNRYDIRLNLFLPRDKNGHVWLDGFQLEKNHLTNYRSKNEISIGVNADDKDIPLFYTDEAVTGKAIFFAWRAKKSLTLEYQLKDYYRGNIISIKRETIDLPQNKCIEKKFRYPSMKRGSYKLWIRLLTPDGKVIVKKDFLFACITKEKKAHFKDDSFFGMHLPCTYCVDWRKYWGTKPRYELVFRQDIDPEVYFRIAKDIGVKWLRVFRIFGMGFIEPHRDEYKFEAGEHYVAFAEKYKMRIMPIFACKLSTQKEKAWGTDFTAIPIWAKSKALISKGGSSRGKGESLPDPNIFKDYIYHVVKHFKKHIKAWEIWNEPNVYMQIDNYMLMQRAGYIGAKAADPECLVVGLCGTGDLSGDPLGWIKSAVDKTSYIKSVLDVISVHSYRNPVSDALSFNEELKEIVSKQKTKASPPPIWNTEVGTASVPAYDGYLPAQKPRFAFHIRNPIQQANFLVGKEIMMMSSGISKHFYFVMGYAGSLGPGGITTELMESDGAPRPALAAYDAMTEIMEGTQFIETIKMGKMDFCSVFAKKNKKIVFCWNYGNKGKSYEINFPSNEITALDLMGKKIKVGLAKGKTKIIFGNSPVYIMVSDEKYTLLKKALTDVDVSDGRPCVISYVKLINNGDKKPALAIQIENVTNKEAQVLVSVPALSNGWQLEIQEKKVMLSPMKRKLIIFPVKYVGFGNRLYVRIELNCNGEVLINFSKTLKILEALRSSGTIIIDGKLDEWKKVKPVYLNHASQIKIKNIPHAWEGPQDLSAIVYAMWDDKNLYIAAKVTDNNVVPNKNKDCLYMNDCLELFFDMKIKPDMNHFSLEDYQIVFSPAIAHEKEKCWKRKFGGGTRVDPTKFKFKSLSGKNGYTYEILIPWEQLKCAVGRTIIPKKFTIFGFDIAVDDNDGKFMKRKSQIIWAGDKNNWRDDKNYGLIILK